MNERNVKLLFIIICCFSLCNCKPKDVALEEKINRLENTIENKQIQINQLNATLDELNSKIIKIAEEKELVYYIVIFEVKQTHISLDLTEHLKDSVNAYRFQVPVDKDFYDNVRVGQELTQNFRFGSLLLKGTFGSNKIMIVDKNIIIKEE